MKLPPAQSGQENGPNNLFPVFLKLENLQVLVVGGGYVGYEKLNAILKNSPGANVKLVAQEVSEPVKLLAAGYQGIRLVEKTYEAGDIEESTDLVIVAVNDPALSSQVHADTKAKRKLVNVADKPHLCDFYLGSVVQKGSVKIAISTNGKSPTIAKRLREVLEDMLPAEMENLLENMAQIRRQLKGDLEEKIKRLNEITSGLVSNEQQK